MFFRSSSVSPFLFTLFRSWALDLDFPLAVLDDEFRGIAGMLSLRVVGKRKNCDFLSRIMIEPGVILIESQLAELKQRSHSYSYHHV